MPGQRLVFLISDGFLLTDRTGFQDTSDLYAAISPDLWRLYGQRVRVCYRTRCVTVKIIDCNCQAHRAIDLYADAFRKLAPLSAGRIQVTLSH